MAAMKLAERKAKPTITHASTLCKCGEPLHPMRVELGYSLCLTCSDSLTRPICASFAADIDGNTHVLPGVRHRDYALSTPPKLPHIKL